MRLLHYLEIQNFKHFGDKQRIELDHPAVLIGPNNCGKTTAIQAIALWSQAVKTWFEAKGRSRPKERTATSLNRLNIVSVPVQRTRYFWHNTTVRTGNREIPLLTTVGVQHENAVKPVTMRFRNQGEDLVYCTPDETTHSGPRRALRTVGAPWDTLRIGSPWRLVAAGWAAHHPLPGSSSPAVEHVPTAWSRSARISIRLTCRLGREDCSLCDRTTKLRGYLSTKPGQVHNSAWVHRALRHRRGAHRGAVLGHAGGAAAGGAHRLPAPARSGGR